MTEHIRIDVCRADTPEQKKLLINASINFWRGQGYFLLSDRPDSDTLHVYEGEVRDGIYYEGFGKYEANLSQDATVLIFMKVV